MVVLNMRLGGIECHSIAAVGLSENNILFLPSVDEKRIHFFVARGAAHTVIGRPFLADKGIRLENSQKQGEILSYKESDGRRLYIPIFTLWDTPLCGINEAVPGSGNYKKNF
ncbi:hypothetical protein O181_105775 [Austropuccinia psidii MF-1]|uniref:Uncharacterized protein n=1 Tax=Austropuccinia psidii MF-1 TaxID=1389203 RepID=A0A9Q3PLZ1_9BASI|nr:hypothetical protein [Austropuccinia psidii MF-1]